MPKHNNMEKIYLVTEIYENKLFMLTAFESRKDAESCAGEAKDIMCSISEVKFIKEKKESNNMKLFIVSVNRESVIAAETEEEARKVALNLNQTLIDQTDDAVVIGSVTEIKSISDLPYELDGDYIPWSDHTAQSVKEILNE